MEPTGLDQMVKSDMTIIGAAGMALSAFFYKMWRIIKSDKSSDKIDDEEQKFRDMLRTELEVAKSKLESLYQENVDLKSRLTACEIRLEYTKKIYEMNKPSEEKREI